MRLGCKLFLVAAAAIAMIAFATPAANAVEVTTETGGHCGEVDVSNAHVVSGGCVVEAETTDAAGQIVFRGHFATLGEIVVTNCDSLFNIRLHESGNGYIFDQEITGPNCGLEACDKAAPSHARLPWPAQLMEFGGAEALQFTFCTRPGTHQGPPEQEGTAFNTCTLYVPMVTHGDHQYEFDTLAPGPSTPTAGGPPMQSRCPQNAAVSISGEWTIHDTPIEITH